MTEAQQGRGNRKEKETREIEMKDERMLSHGRTGERERGERMTATKRKMRRERFWGGENRKNKEEREEKTIITEPERDKKVSGGFVSFSRLAVSVKSHEHHLIREGC